VVLRKREIILVLVTPILIAVLILVVTPFYEKYVEENINMDTFAKILNEGDVEKFNEYKIEFDDEIILSRVNVVGGNLRGIDLSFSSFYVSNFTNTNLTAANMKKYYIVRRYFWC